MNTTKRSTKKSHHIFVLVKENTEPTVQNVRYPRSRTIVALDEVYDEKEDVNRIIRYLPGEQSIYLDEQTDQDLKKRRPQEIVFMNGSLIVDKRQATLLKFIQACNFFEGNSNRMPNKEVIFREHAPEVTAKSAMQEDMNISNAKSMVYAMDLKELISYARVLDIDINRPIDLIRWDMSAVASNDPNWFLENKNSPSTTRMHYLFEALDLEIIKVTTADRTVRWSNGQAIVQSPIGIDPLDALVDLTFEKDGEIIYETIINKIRIPEQDTEESVTGADVLKEMSNKNPFKKEYVEKEDKPAFTSKNMEIPLLVDECLTEGVIYKKGPAHHYFKEINIGKGRNGVIKYLEDPKHQTLKKSMIKALDHKKNA